MNAPAPVDFQADDSTQHSLSLAEVRWWVRIGYYLAKIRVRTPTRAADQMETQTYCPNLEPRPFRFRHPTDLDPLGVVFGRGAGPLEVAIAWAPCRPRPATLRSAWKDRLDGRGVPLVLVVLYSNRAAVCGADGDVPAMLMDLNPTTVARICLDALQEPNRHAALRFLWEALPELKRTYWE